jgi:hypothetical protein
VPERAREEKSLDALELVISDVAAPLEIFFAMKPANLSEAIRADDVMARLLASFDRETKRSERRGTSLARGLNDVFFRRHQHHGEWDALVQMHVTVRRFAELLHFAAAFRTLRDVKPIDFKYATSFAVSTAPPQFAHVDAAAFVFFMGSRQSQCGTGLNTRRMFSS